MRHACPVKLGSLVGRADLMLLPWDGRALPLLQTQREEDSLNFYMKPRPFTKKKGDSSLVKGFEHSS